MKTVPNAVKRLLIMARKLFRFITVIAALTCGLWLWLYVGIGSGHGWIRAKSGVVALLVIYHAYCGVLLRTVERGEKGARKSGFGCSTNSSCWGC
jgi:putative membrane protein